VLFEVISFKIQILIPNWAFSRLGERLLRKASGIELSTHNTLEDAT